MIDYIFDSDENPMTNVTIDLGTDRPLYQYVIKALKSMEIIQLMRLNPIKDAPKETYPFLIVGNFKWNPHPDPSELQTRRRETGTKIQTKSIADIRVGLLDFDIVWGARDKNKFLEKHVDHNTLMIPIADDQGRYLLDNELYTEYQLVDKFLYPSGANSVTLKSLLPIVVRRSEHDLISMDGYVITCTKVMDVMIFKTYESIITCFMHITSPLSFLGVFPLVQYTDTIMDDKQDYEYFQPIKDRDIYLKAYRKGLEKFEYVRSVVYMLVQVIKEYEPADLDELRDPSWWVYQLSYYPNNEIEHRGACNVMHVARMLDSISAWELPIPECDKRNMVSLLRYVLQTEFVDVNIYSFENKRIRLNEVISTIVTAKVSDNLKRLFRFGILAKAKDSEASMKFSPNLIISKIHSLGTVHTTDFTNDMDYYQSLKVTRKGPNALGRTDQHKVGFGHKQLNPSQIGVIDLFESVKDVGQTCMLSPYADLTILKEYDRNKYPNIKYDLFKFIQDEFRDYSAIYFNCETIEEYNDILDKLCYESTITMDYFIPNIIANGTEGFIMNSKGGF